MNSFGNVRQKTSTKNRDASLRKKFFDTRDFQKHQKDPFANSFGTVIL